MAKHLFKKGDKARKGKYIAPEVFEGRKITKVMWEQAIHKYMNFTKDQLEAIMRDPQDTPAFEILVISILGKAVMQGDVLRAEFLLARIIGKVPDRVEVKDVTDETQVEEKIKELKNDYLAIVGKVES